MKRALVVVLCTTVSAHAAVFGNDDRLDVRLAPPPFAALADSAVMMLTTEAWRWCDDALKLAESATTVGASQQLCPGEPFADEPVVARCGGTLIAPDVVVTAAHCLQADPTCTNTLFARSAINDDVGVVLPGFTEVSRCRVVLARPPASDVVIVALEQPLADRVAVIGPPPATGASIATLGHPSGMPLKFSPCTVQGSRLGSDGGVALIDQDCDVFRGSSGGGVFDNQGRLFGVISRAAGDFVPDGDCFVRTRYADDGTLAGVGSQPQFGTATTINAAIGALCGGGFAGPVCGTTSDAPAPSASCGDGACSIDQERRCGDCAFLGCGEGEGEELADDRGGCSGNLPGATAALAVVVWRRRRCSAIT